jgi:phosphonate transport system ATP-binding protein
MLPCEIRQAIPHARATGASPTAWRPRDPGHWKPGPAYRDGASRAALGKRVEGIGRPLFRCITGLLAPDQGTVRIGMSEVTSVMTRRLREVAVIFQQFNLVNRLTALENVLAGRLGYVPAWRGWLRRFDRSDRLLALECLDRVGLMDLAMRRADTLSGGQQQRVAIARALAQCPTLIVADEPVASLDPSTSAGVLDLLHGIARSEGVAVVCSLHQVHLARAYADRIVGLSSGRVVFDLPAAKFDENAFQRLYRSHVTDNVT